MKPSKDSLPSVEPAFFTLKDLTVRALREEEYPRASERLQREHSLGDCPGRRQIEVHPFEKGQPQLRPVRPAGLPPREPSPQWRSDKQTIPGSAGVLARIPGRKNYRTVAYPSAIEPSPPV
jgi:hypothetical protein